MKNKRDGMGSRRVLAKANTLDVARLDLQSRIMWLIARYAPLIMNRIKGVHLANCHLSKCCDLTEVQLFLAGAGISRLSATQVAGMTICPRHRHLLGRFWRPPKSCQYPGHTGKVASVAGRRVVNFQIADEIRLLFGKSTALGSRKCNLFLLPPLHTVIHPVKVRTTFLLPKLFCFANAYLTD